MSTHTPGPWAVETDGENWNVCGPNGETVVRFRSQDREADARLIAAAPDLIETLRYALKALEKVEAPIFTQRYAIGRIARAIHNATGEPVVAANTFSGVRHMTDWRPIATAPTDGTEILGWERGRFYVLAYVEAGEWVDSAYIKRVDLTHWAPLPDEPIPYTLTDAGRAALKGKSE